MAEFASLLDFMRDPLLEVANSDQRSVLAFITDVEGPSYRPLGAAMAFFEDNLRIGTLSSGCIEGDLAWHAAQCMETGKSQTVRYGAGSPYIDIQLPCGGGLEITLIPNPDKSVLSQICEKRENRQPISMEIDLASGRVSESTSQATGKTDNTFNIHYEPEIRFVILGKGPEAACLSALVQASGFPNIVYSPDEDTRSSVEASGGKAILLIKDKFPQDITIDPWTAIVLFFHDHDWEPELLKSAVKTPAFYIGAQGSQRARDARYEELRRIGVNEAEIEKLSGPIGLVPSARDARTLAVSVLSEILAVRKQKLG